MTANTSNQEKSVVCKMKLTRTQIVIVSIFGGMLLLFIAAFIYGFYTNHIVWVMLMPIALLLYIVLSILCRSGYVFTQKDIRKRRPVLGEEFICKYSDIDRYYLVYCDSSHVIPIGETGYLDHVEAADYWFMKDDKVVFSLSAKHQNMEEARQLFPFPYSGEMQLSRQQYFAHDISSAMTKEEIENVSPEALQDDIIIQAKNGCAPGCVGYLLIALFAPILITAPLQYLAGNTNENSGTALIIMLVFGLAIFLFIYYNGRKNGWVVIDERNGILTLKSAAKPFVKNKTLPISEVTLVRIDRQKGKTTIYEGKGEWCYFLHQATRNYNKVYEALIALKAKGKLNVEEVK